MTEEGTKRNQPLGPTMLRMVSDLEKFIIMWHLTFIIFHENVKSNLLNLWF